jgi:putative ABC transport system permease protein
MIKNYLKLGFRNLVKNKLSSSINILGLALAVGCCMVVFTFFDWSMHMDTFHKKINNLFVIERLSSQNGNDQLWGDSPAPMGPMLKSEFPQIKDAVRLSNIGVIIKRGDNVFNQHVTFADNGFYKMFDFPVKWGNKTDFTAQDGIILTEELSDKLFGKANPTGKTISVTFNKEGVQTLVSFTVKGVFAKMPREASFYFQAIVPYSKMIALGIDKPGDWSQHSSITFIEATNEASLAPVKKATAQYLKLYNAANTDNKIVGFNFQPLSAMNFHSYKVYNEQFNSTHIAAYLMLLVIGLATLLLVYFNYMNIAIAAASTRLKEIGIRKVMGSQRKQIIFQFIIENVILCTAAISVGLLLAKYIFLPLFSQIVNVDLTQNLFDNYRTWIALVLLIIVSALSGAAYPSIYISAFNPINIMKGNSKTGSNNRFRKALLGFQFFLTFLAISTALAFMQETRFIKAQPWGYDPSNNVVVNLDKSASYRAFKDKLKSTTNVIAVTGSVESLGNYTKQLVVNIEGQKQTVNSISALPGFATQMGIKINKGRDLSEAFQTDAADAVLVNQAFMKQMRWITAVGKNVNYNGHNYLVIGEVNDFHYNDFQAPVGPLILMGCKPEDVTSVYVKTNPALFSNAHSGIEKIWKEINPNLPFEYHYQEAVFDVYFNSFVQVAQVLAGASIVMMIISVTGIFGLALLILGKKMKEISVRKVLGAGMGNVVFLINKEFLYAIGFAVLIGFPFSWWLTGNLLNILVPNPIVSFSPLILAFLSLIVMTAISVSWHIYKAHTANPTKYLKEE